VPEDPVENVAAGWSKDEALYAGDGEDFTAAGTHRLFPCLPGLLRGSQLPAVATE